MHLLLITDPSSPIAPPSLVPLGLAGFILPLCTNVLVTALIIARIWLLTPRRLRDMHNVYIPQGMGCAVIGIVIESGALYLVVQLVFVILFATHHPAQGVVAVIAVQIYVRTFIAHFGSSSGFSSSVRVSRQNHHYTGCARHVKYTVREVWR